MFKWFLFLLIVLFLQNRIHFIWILLLSVKSPSADLTWNRGAKRIMANIERWWYKYFQKYFKLRNFFISVEEGTWGHRGPCSLVLVTRYQLSENSKTLSETSRINTSYFLLFSSKWIAQIAFKCVKALRKMYLVKSSHFLSFISDSRRTFRVSIQLNFPTQLFKCYGLTSINLTLHQAIWWLALETRLLVPLFSMLEA